MSHVSDGLDIKAQITFMHRVLRAVVRSHPNPEALRDAWQEESSEALAHLGIQQVALDAADDVTQAYQKAFWQWAGLISEEVNRGGS